MIATAKESVLMYVIRDKNGAYLTNSDDWGDDGWCWCELLIDRQPEYAPYIWTNLEECYQIQQLYAKDAEVLMLKLENILS